ncbi:hypothetical protein WJ966_04060 [Achromobacter xylosoxidans]
MGPGRPGFTPRWKKRFYSAVADIAVNAKAGLVLAMSHRQSRIERWIMSVDDKGKPCARPTSIAIASTISWENSACMPAPTRWPT